MAGTWQPGGRRGGRGPTGLQAASTQCTPQTRTLRGGCVSLRGRFPPTWGLATWGSLRLHWAALLSQAAPDAAHSPGDRAAPSSVLSRPEARLSASPSLCDCPSHMWLLGSFKIGSVFGLRPGPARLLERASPPRVALGCPPGFCPTQTRETSTPARVAHIKAPQLLPPSGQRSIRLPNPELPILRGAGRRPPMGSQDSGARVRRRRADFGPVDAGKQRSRGAGERGAVSDLGSVPTSCRNPGS